MPADVGEGSEYGLEWAIEDHLVHRVPGPADLVDHEAARQVADGGAAAVQTIIPIEVFRHMFSGRVGDDVLLRVAWR
jgi:hypothetical protein